MAISAPDMSERKDTFEYFSNLLLSMNWTIMPANISRIKKLQYPIIFKFSIPELTGTIVNNPSGMEPDHISMHHMVQINQSGTNQIADHREDSIKNIPSLR